MKAITLPQGTVLSVGDTVNYRTTFGRKSTGKIIDVKEKTGDHGWMQVKDTNGGSDWVSLVNQLKHIGENNIKAN